MYACPVNEERDAEDELATLDVLVDVLNGGLDSVMGVASEDMEEDIDEFKCEILGGSYDEHSGCSNGTINLSDEISEQAVIDYLNSQNEEQ